MPFGATAGCAEKSAGLSEQTVNLTIWPDSDGGPGEMFVAQPLTDCGPESS